MAKHSRLMQIRDRYLGAQPNCALDVTGDVVWLLDALGKACDAADGRDRLEAAHDALQTELQATRDDNHVLRARAQDGEMDAGIKRLERDEARALIVALRIGRWLQFDHADGVAGEDSIWICNCTQDDGTVGTEPGSSERCADCVAQRPESPDQGEEK